jgi:hypothetical protein
VAGSLAVCNPAELTSVAGVAALSHPAARQRSITVRQASSFLTKPTGDCKSGYQISGSVAQADRGLLISVNIWIALAQRRGAALRGALWTIARRARGS